MGRLSQLEGVAKSKHVCSGGEGGDEDNDDNDILACWMPNIVWVTGAEMI